MRDLNRFEYLQLAAQLLPKKEIIARNQDIPLEQLYEILSDEMFLMAKIIRENYQARYRYEGEADSFNLSNHIDRGEF